MFTCCPKDPHYVLGQCFIYIIILNDHVLCVIALVLTLYTLCIKDPLCFSIRVFIVGTLLGQ